MRALQLDFQRTYKPAPWLGLGVLVAALVALAAMAGYYQTLNEQIRYWQDKADQVTRLPGHRAAVSPPLTQQAARAQLLEVKQANRVVRQLGQPWNALFNAVESSGKEVALLSLEPDLQKGMVTIGGEAKDFDALLNYVKELSAREVFASVMLQNHQIQREIAEKPVRFSLIAHLKGVAP
jgi:Tfp pilus assembly protein PilN